MVRSFTKTRLFVELMSSLRIKKNGSSVIKLLTPVKTLMLFDTIENSVVGMCPIHCMPNANHTDRERKLRKYYRQ